MRLPLNVLLRDMVNPATSSKPEVNRGTRIYRLGDKVQFPDETEEQREVGDLLEQLSTWAT